MKSSQYSRRGQSMVETSLVVTSLLVLILAILDLGHFFFMYHVLTERVREGARWASVNGVNASHPDAVKNVVVYNDPSPRVSSPGLFGLTPEMVTVQTLPNAKDARFVEVGIDFPVTLFTPFLGRGFSGHFRAVRPVE